MLPDWLPWLLQVNDSAVSRREPMRIRSGSKNSVQSGSCAMRTICCDFLRDTDRAIALRTSSCRCLRSRTRRHARGDVEELARSRSGTRSAGNSPPNFARPAGRWDRGGLRSSARWRSGATARRIRRQRHALPPSRRLRAGTALASRRRRRLRICAADASAATPGGRQAAASRPGEVPSRFSARSVIELRPDHRAGGCRRAARSRPAGSIRCSRSPRSGMRAPANASSFHDSNRIDSKRPFRLGIGGPVGSGKTMCVLRLCQWLKDDYSLAVITNDIYTREDAEFLLRQNAAAGGPRGRGRDRRMPAHGHPRRHHHEHGSGDRAREAAPGPGSHPDRERRRQPLRDLLAELADAFIFVIDVAEGDKIPRKGGPAIRHSDLLLINKTDLAPFVGRGPRNDGARCAGRCAASARFSLPI